MHQNLLELGVGFMFGRGLEQADLEAGRLGDAVDADTDVADEVVGAVGRVDAPLFDSMGTSYEHMFGFGKRADSNFCKKTTDTIK